MGRLDITSTATVPGGGTFTIDDTAFVPRGAAYLLVTDVGSGHHLPHRSFRLSGLSLVRLTPRPTPRA